jgi:hypothetical protein
MGLADDGQRGSAIRHAEHYLDTPEVSMILKAETLPLDNIGAAKLCT